MATRTLGIKYEIKGYKEATESLKNLRLGIKKNQQANQELSEQQIKNSKKVAAVEQKNRRPGAQSTDNLETRIKVDKKPTRYTGSQEKISYKLQAEIIASAVKEAIELTNDDLFAEYAEIFQKFQQGNVKGGLLQFIKRPISSIVAGYYEAIGGEFGSRVGQRILGLRSSNVTSFKNRSAERTTGITVKLTSENIKDLVKGLTYSIKNTGGLNLNLVADSKQITPGFKENQGNLFTNIIGNFTKKIQLVSSGYFEGIGNYFGEQFASGLSEVLDDELDYSQKRKGRVFGKSVSFVAKDGLENLNEKFATLKYTIADLNDETQEVDFARIKNFVSALVGIPNSLVDSYFTGFRRASVQEEATRKVNPNEAEFNEELGDLSDVDNIIITASGFAGEQGKQGRKQAEKLREINQNDRTKIISSDTSFTDVMFQATDAASGAAWGVNAVANAAKINLKGFNPDSVELVNKVLALREKNPEIQVKLVGHSAGGFVAEEAQYLLELLGIKGVTTVTAGTPNLKGNLKPEQIRRIFADRDPLEMLHQFGEAIDFVNDDTEYDAIPGGHFFEQYIASERVRRAIFDFDESEGGRPPEAPPDAPPGAPGGSPPFPSAPDFDDSLAEIRANFEAYITSINQALDELRQNIANNLNPINVVGSAAGNLRRARLSTEGQAALEKTIRERNFDEIAVQQGVDTLVAVIGGYAGNGGRSGQIFANQLKTIAPEDRTQYIGLTNEFTDVIRVEEFNEGGIEGREKSLTRILDMFAQVHQLGYNPDAVKAAAEIIQLQQQNPELNIKIAGYSGGGYVAEDLIKLLEDYGADLSKISVMGIGTPKLPGRIESANYEQVLGEHDPVLQVDKLKQFNNTVRELLGFDIFPELAADIQNIEGIDEHSLQQYVFLSEEIQRFLYRDTDKIAALASIYSDLNKAQKQVGQLAIKLREIQQGNLPEQQKLNAVNKLSEDYIRSLMAISRLAEQAVEVGGGRYFSRQKRQAQEGLRRFGINYTQESVAPQAEPINQVEKTPQELVEEYRQYLERLIDDAREHAHEIVTAFIPKFDDLENDDDRKRYLKAIRQDIEELAQFYRETLNEGDLEHAREIGEALLQRIQAVRQIYQEIRENSGSDPSLAANMGRLTAIETEIRVGQPNLRGRAKMGLEEYFAQWVAEYQQAGGEVTNGFVEGILADLEEIRRAGEAIGEEAADATRNNLDIQSPSQVFRRIGHYLVEGFNLGIGETDLESLRDLQNQLDGVNFDLQLFDDNEIVNALLQRREILTAQIEELLNLLSTEPQEILAQELREQISSRTEQLRAVLENLAELVGESTAEASEETVNDAAEQTNITEGLINRVRRRFDSLLERFPILRQATRFLAPVAAMFLGGLGIKTVIGLMQSLSKEFFAAAMAAETLDRAIIFSSRNALEGRRNLQYITQTAEQLDIDVNAAKENYSSMIGASKGTSLEGMQTEQIFEAFAETATLRGIDAQNQDRLFTALSQIIGKRKLTAEEVRGQIGDIAGMGDFISLVAEAQGVSTPQLEKMMSQGEVKIDVLPKIAATLKAQNSLADGTKTAQALQTRYNNSLGKFKATLGAIFQPLQKLELRIKSLGLEALTNNLDLLFNILMNILMIALLAILKHFQLLPILINAVTFGVKGLIAALAKIWAARAMLMQVAGAWLLISLAIASASNAIEVWRNNARESYKDINLLAKGVEALKRAWHEANSAQEEYNNNLPTKSKDLTIDKGLNLPDNWFGKMLLPVIGGDNLNLDNLIRKRLVNIEIWAKTGIRDTASRIGWTGLEERYERRLRNRNFKTLAEKNQLERIIAISDYASVSDQILLANNQVLDSIRKIANLDSQIADVQSARLDLLPHEKDKLEASLKTERELQKERDKQLKILTTQKENLQRIINTGKKELDNLESDKASRSITESNYQQQRKTVEDRIEAATSKLEDLNQQIAKVPNNLSVFERYLRNANERLQGVFEEADIRLQQNKTQLINQGLAEGKGEQAIQLEITQLENEDIQNRIKELNQEIANLTKKLGSAELDQGIKRLEASAREQGLSLTTETLNRLKEEERSSEEKKAAKALIELRNLQGQLGNYQEQLAQNAQQTRNNLIDFNRTIQDYFFNLQQRIKEAQIETERLVNQIFYQDIKSQLRRAIAPGSESFINGIIDGVQSLLDQAQQIFEQRLGLRSSKIQFESEAYSNAREMEDFVRQIRGASGALLEFRNNLVSNNSGNNITSKNNSVKTNNFPLPGLSLDTATITSGFGWRNIFGRQDFHEGIDIAAKGGSDVLAVRSGVVKYIKPLADQMQVAVESINDAGDRVVEWFIHLGQKLNVAVGDRVSAGQKIGEVAHTSAYARKQRVSTGDHLDYRATVNGQWVDPKTLLSDASLGLNSQNERSAIRAIAANEAFNNEKLQQLNLQEIFNSFGIKDLETTVADQKEKIRRQFQIEELQQDNKFAELLNKVANLQEQSVRPNANIETQRELRQVASEFRNFKFEGLQEVQALADELATIEGVLQIFPDAISKIRASGSEEALAVLPVLEQILTDAQNALPQVQNKLEETRDIYKAIAEESAKRVAFIEEQGKLKKQLESVVRREELQQLRSNIAAQRGTNEQRRQNELAAERLRLEKRITEIRQQYGDTDQANELIKLEEKNSAISESNINMEAYNRDLSYEQELLNINSGIEDRKAELARYQGSEMEANKIQRENAIAQENFRYKQQIAQLEQQYAGEPEKLAKLKQQAEALNQVNLESINYQFKDLGMTIRENALGEFQNFFGELVKDLDNVGDLFKKMLGNMANNIAEAFAKRASRNIFDAIFGTPTVAVNGGSIFGSIGNIFAGLFKYGGTVPNYDEGGTVLDAVAHGGNPQDRAASLERVVPTPISDRLQELSAPIRNAFRREGSGGRLAVFTPGEEILSIKTGEAGRYQGLKRQLGINPLEKIFEGNFLDGGTIEANLLAGLDYKIPNINVAAIEGRERIAQPNTTQVYNLSSTFVTPDLDSFKASEYQIQQEQLEQLRWMNGRRQ
ncbi:MAG: peptidoglycan DD-metalloendopeptidase family protein [Xenococcus sp. MO_188.B8]|nr:peptidoglycan DD-metalloendopeptidase family protein [Xenococcus sp. MO_188.B8]